jgi:hypothetical protein
MKAMRDNPRQLIIYLYLLFLGIALITYGTEALANAPEEESRVFSVGPKTIDSGLDALDSYRTVFELDFDGYRAEQPVSGRVTLTRTVITSESALHQVQQITSDDGNPPRYPRSEYFKVGDTVVVRRGNELIQVESGAPEKFGQYALAEWFVLPKLVGVAPTFGKLGPTHVQEYVFDDADLSDPWLKFEAAQGQMWVNTAGNFVMAYALTGTVQAKSPLDGAYLLDEGTVSLRYRVLETDSGLTIDPPPVGAKNALVALPHLPNARLTTVFPTYVELTSPTSPISATLFYQDGLAAQGWKSQTAAVFREKAALTFEKGRQALNILITPTIEPGYIKVVLESGQIEAKPQPAKPE